MSEKRQEIKKHCELPTLIIMLLIIIKILDCLKKNLIVYRAQLFERGLALTRG